MSLLEYLTNKSPVQGYVSGNEACYADSFVSALVTAFCLTQSTGRLYVPIAQCTREDFTALKREISALLEICNFPIQPVLERFLFLEDFSWSEISPLVLTDHNEPSDPAVKFSSVELAIDHHEVISDLPYPHVIERVGSCCTLVAREFWKFLDLSAQRLLLAVILLDTNNLKEKTKTADLEISAQLKKITQISDHTCQEISDKLLAVRRDKNFWKSLAPKFLLKVDLKNFRTFAAATVRLGLREISDQIELAMSDLGRELDVKVVLLLTAHAGGRELTAWTATPEISAHLDQGIRTSGLQVEQLPSYGNLKSWSHAGDATRKQVAPIVARCLSQISHLL